METFHQRLAEWTVTVLCWLKHWKTLLWATDLESKLFVYENRTSTAECVQYWMKNYMWETWERLSWHKLLKGNVIKGRSIRCIDPTLLCWSTVHDAGPALEQHMFNGSCLLGCTYPANTTHLPNVGPMLTHRLRRWPNIEPTLDYMLGRHTDIINWICWNVTEISTAWNKRKACQVQKCPQKYILVVLMQSPLQLLVSVLMQSSLHLLAAALMQSPLQLLAYVLMQSPLQLLIVVFMQSPLQLLAYVLMQSPLQLLIVVFMQSPLQLLAGRGP